MSCHVVSWVPASVSVHKLWRNHGLERWGMHGGSRQLTTSAKAHLTPQSKEKDWEEPHFSAFGEPLFIGPGAFPMNSILLYHSWCWGHLRATSHMRLRAHDHYTSRHSHWWKRRNRSRFTSHYACGTNGVCECKMDVRSTWISTWYKMDHIHGHLDYFQKPPLGGRINTKPINHGTLNACNC
jgi:hypothetical protein